MTSQRVYLGIGSNLGDSISLVEKTLAAISNLSQLSSFRASRLFQTTPVSHIPQGDYINAVCTFITPMPPEDLFDLLQGIEVKMGKTPKGKADPRVIDIDILFFGQRFLHAEQLQIPHLRWKERLFVMQPLLDLTDEIAVPIDAKGTVETVCLKDFLKNFSNPHLERVFPLNKTT